MTQHTLNKPFCPSNINPKPLSRLFRLLLPIPLIIAFLLIPSYAYAETGTASFYGNGEPLNKHTANGEVFDPSKMTAATYIYPFNTILKVMNIENGKSVIVRVNDRGPNKRLNRVIDLTRDAFKQIASLSKGIVTVKVERYETRR